MQGDVHSEEVKRKKSHRRIKMVPKINCFPFRIHGYHCIHNGALVNKEPI